MVWMWDAPKGPCLNTGSPAVWQCLWWDVDCGLASRNEWLGAGLEGATHFLLQGYSLSSALPDPPWRLPPQPAQSLGGMHSVRMET